MLGSALGKVMATWPNLFGMGVVLAFTLVAEWDLLFSKQLLIGMDTATAFYPWYSFLGEQLRGGHIPVWNPHTFSGTPFAADPESGWMYLPAMVAFALLPLDAAARSFMLFHAVLAGLSLFAFARALDLSPGSSAVAALAYVGSGFFLGHNVCCWAYAGVAAWLPLMLLGVERALHASSWRTRGAWCGLAGLALSQILAVWIGQGAYYALLVLGSFVAYRTLLADGCLRSRVQALAIHSGGILLFGFALAAAGLLPRLEYNVLSNLPGGYQDGSTVLRSWMDWGILDNWYQRLLQPGFSYLGWSVLGLAVAAPVLVRRRYTVPYFAGLSLAVLILARYEPTPLHLLLSSTLPGFERIHARSPERALIVFYLGPALLAGASASWLQSRFSRRLSVLAVALVAAELQLAWSAQRAESLAGGGDYQFKQVELAAYYAPTGAAQFLQNKSHAEKFRYFGYAQHIWGGPIPYTLRWADPSITALQANNRALVAGLDDVQGYNPIHLARYDEFMAALNGHSQNYHHTDVFDTGLDSPLLDLLNVRYIVIPAQTAQDQVTPRFRRPVQTVYQDDDVRVVENPGALPRAWWVHSAELVPSGQSLTTLAARAAELKQVAFLEQPEPPLGQPDDASRDQVSISADEADRIRLHTQSTAAGLVILSEVSYPAWHAYLDGQAVPVYVADHALRAVAVPAGEHRLEMRYESLALSVGLVISLSGAAALLGLVVRMPRARRVSEMIRTAAFILVRATA
jgi:hypothetical protein